MHPRVGARGGLASYPVGDFDADGFQVTAFTVTSTPHTYTKLNEGSTVSILQPTDAVIDSQDSTTATLSGATGRFMVKEEA